MTQALPRAAEPLRPSALRHVAAMMRFLTGLCERMPYAVPALALRVFPAVVFWRSGRTKVDGWELAPSTFYLFREEYRVPVLDPVHAAYLATWAEHVFPVLLVLGLATRFSALALLGMTAVIQLFVYPGAWPTHGLWAACFLMLIARGPGAVSLDRLVERWWMRQPPASGEQRDQRRRDQGGGETQIGGA